MRKYQIVVTRIVVISSIVLGAGWPNFVHAQGSQVGPQATQVTITPLSGYTCPGETTQTTIMSEGFEGAWPTTSWTVTGNPTWDDSNYKPRTGSWSAWPARGGSSGVDPTTNNYPINMNARMIYGPFNLSNAVGARLTFYYWNQSESNYDWFHWLVSTNATNFYGYRVSGDSNGWQSVTFDLSNVPTHGSALGTTCVWVGFFFTSDGSVNYKGPFVDDIVLEKTRWGAVFDPNPIASTGNTSLVDNSDADSVGLTSARFGRGLKGLDGTGYLRGTYADLATGNGNFSGCNTGISRGLAFDSKLQFVYTRSDDRFEEANIYYHVDSAQRYLQSLSLGFNVLNSAIPIHAHCFSGQGAQSNNAPLTMLFSEGGVDTGEDGEVVVHEYGHLILYEQVPIYTPLDIEGDVIHEGFGDYWSATVLSNRQPASWQLCFAEWSATTYPVPYTNPSCHRRLDNNKVYPQDMALEYHLAGQIWSGALWQIRGALGQNVADRLVIKSHTYLDSDMRFGEAANSLVSADIAQNSMANFSTIVNTMRGRGIFDSYEWNNNTSWATSITPNAGAQFHRIGAKSDVDWFRFTTNGFGPSWRYAYRIRTFGLASGVDTEITAYAPNGFTILGNNDDCPGAGNLSSCLLLAASTTDNYYVVVTPHVASRSATGYNKTYQIEITTVYLPNSVYLPIVMR